MAGDWDVRAIAAGFLGAALVLAVLLWFVGVDAVIEQLGTADLRFVFPLLFVAVLWLLFWALALRSVLDTLGISLSIRTAFLVYAAATFVNNITPFGQAGGEPISALLIARVSDSEYETGLAAIASVDAINFVPSVGLAFVAVSYYAVTVTLTDRLVDAASVLAVLVVLVVVAGTFAWRARYQIEERLLGVVTHVVDAVDRYVPRVKPPRPDAIRHRIENFFTTIERVAYDRRSIAVTLSFSTIGWLMLVICLWLSLLALGVRGDDLFVAAMLAVPLGTVASVTPLPGGLGGIETVLLMILPTVTGVGAATISAVILLHRFATYWFPVFLGGGATTALGAAERE
ncbi:lysylphosphatidylglycerol synthase transmembrane domain-containing protein [Haloarchaeobius sp. HRN-SO-5]|uniref:lysylphosphatidylglycerol synthase transmembrane domain-containing protein n=1 Tax=Haloarchaeobius sp. HRN-SO-5 TaxID=3446118 RepID=UPI003EB9BFA9